MRPPGTPTHLPGGEWLYAKLYTAAERHTGLLAHEVPKLLASLPRGIDRWFFVRYRDPQPHLRLRFHCAGTTGALTALHSWAEELRGRGLAGDLVLAAYDPELERYGGPAAMAAAERVFHADSVLVLNLLRLTTTGTLDADPLVLAAAGYAQLGRVFAPETWQDWVPAGPDEHAVFRRVRDSALARVAVERDIAPALRDLPGGTVLERSWARRAAAVAEYAGLVHGSPWTPADEVFRSLAHMHHNRFVGGDREHELRSYAVLRGVIRAHRSLRAVQERQVGR